jgi:hypothetical protein
MNTSKREKETPIISKEIRRRAGTIAINNISS